VDHLYNNVSSITLLIINAVIGAFFLYCVYVGRKIVEKVSVSASLLLEFYRKSVILCFCRVFKAQYT